MATTRWFRVVVSIALGGFLAARVGATEENAEVSGEARIVPDFSAAAHLRALLLLSARDGFLDVVLEPASGTIPVRSLSFQTMPIVPKMETRRDWLDEIPDLEAVRYPHLLPLIPGVRQNAGN
jgi:hypothetical protein